MRSINARSRASISSAGKPFERAAKYECAPKEDLALNPQRHTPPVISCGKMTPRGRAYLVSLRTDAVGHTSSARHAASLSSCVFGCRAKTLLSFRSTMSAGATCREAPQSMHAVSMYQSPGAESGLRGGFIR
jgi:hypothetical protein